MDGQQITKEKVNVIIYSDAKYSFTKEISNELIYNYPNKIIVIAREKSGEMKCSLRNTGKTNLAELLQKILPQTGGYGGGHEHACGACIPTEKFEAFINLLKQG